MSGYNPTQDINQDALTKDTDMIMPFNHSLFHQTQLAAPTLCVSLHAQLLATSTCNSHGTQQHTDHMGTACAKDLSVVSSFKDGNVEAIPRARTSLVGVPPPPLNLSMESPYPSLAGKLQPSNTASQWNC